MQQLPYPITLSFNIGFHLPKLPRQKTLIDHSRFKLHIHCRGEKKAKTKNLSHMVQYIIWRDAKSIDCYQIKSNKSDYCSEDKAW